MKGKFKQWSQQNHLKGMINGPSYIELNSKTLSYSSYIELSEGVKYVWHPLYKTDRVFKFLKQLL